MAGYLASPRGLILPPWAPRSPVIAKSSSPGGAEPDGSCSLPGSYSLRSRQWQGKGAGTTGKDGGRRRDDDPGFVVHALRLFPAEMGERTTIKMAADHAPSAATPAGERSPFF